MSLKVALCDGQDHDLGLQYLQQHVPKRTAIGFKCGPVDVAEFAPSRIGGDG